MTKISNFINNDLPRYTGLEAAKKYTGKWLNEHPNIYKIVVLAACFFRTAMMVFAMAALPFTPVVNTAFMIGGSILYAVAIEKHCTFPFAIPSLLGAYCYNYSKPALVSLINRTAFTSMQAVADAFVKTLPLDLWLISIVFLFNKQVDDAVFKVNDRDCCQ